MTDYRQRVRSAVRILREFACRTEDLTIFVSPDVVHGMMRAVLNGEDEFALEMPVNPDRGYRYLGLALAVDYDYPPDTIALRFEVKA